MINHSYKSPNSLSFFKCALPHFLISKRVGATTWSEKSQVSHESRSAANTLEIRLGTLYLLSLPGMSKKEALVQGLRTWQQEGVFLWENHQAFFVPLSYEWCLYGQNEGESYGGHRRVKWFAHTHRMGDIWALILESDPCEESPARLCYSFSISTVDFFNLSHPDNFFLLYFVCTSSLQGDVKMKTKGPLALWSRFSPTEPSMATTGKHISSVWIPALHSVLPVIICFR